MEYYKPFPLVRRTQVFGANANPLYASQGLLGHTSEDWGGQHNEPVRCCADKSFCYSIMNKDNFDPTKYRAVYTLVDKGDDLFDEISYGHANRIFAVPGRTYDTGDIIMTMGNTGDVYAGGRKITKEERLNGSKLGTHLHGIQVRPCKRVKQRVPGKVYLSDGFGVYKKDGYYFEVLDHDNGYNGCVPALSKVETAEEIAVRRIGLINDALKLAKFLLNRMKA